MPLLAGNQKRQLRKITAALVALTGLVGAGLAQADSAAAQEDGDTTFKLSGGVSHSDRLEPLPADERVGAPAVNQNFNPASTQVPTQVIYQPPSAMPRASRNVAPQLQKGSFVQPQQKRATQPAEQWKLQVPNANQAKYTRVQSQSQIPQQGRQQMVPPVQGQRQYAAGIQQSQQMQQAQQIQRTQQNPSFQGRTPALDQDKTSAAMLQQIKQLNAHITTQGSPMAPRPQVMQTRQSAMGIDPRMQSATAQPDTMSQYQKNLRAMAVFDNQRNPNKQAIQGGVQGRQGQSAKVEVPFWLAGEWLRSETNESSRIELPSGKYLKAVGVQKAVADDVFGTYKDKDGRVWMVVPLRNRGSVDRGFAIDRHQVNKYELILTGKTSALVKVQASHSVVDKKTNRVIKAYQDEELNQYSLVRDGLVKTDSSVKVFDENGNPKLLTHAISLEKRVRKL